MDRKKACALVFVLILLAMASATGSSWAEQAEGRDVTVLTPVTSRIYYQGRLTDSGGAPMTGAHNLRFQVYDVAAGGSALQEQSYSSLNFTDGLFSVQLDADARYFDGRALWLAITVDGQLLSPRQELLPVPYALSMRSGATIRGDAQQGLSSMTSGSYGLVGESTAATAGAGVLGNNTGGVGHGVQGTSTGEAGVAGFGNGIDSYGVYGRVGESGEAGVYGHMNAASGGGDGVFGQTDSSSDYSAGVWGLAASDSGRTYGVAGESASQQGFGGYFANTAQGGSGLYVSSGSDDAADLILGGWAGSQEGRIASDPALPTSSIQILSNDDVSIELDEDNNEQGRFSVLSGSDIELFSVDEVQGVTVAGDLTVAGKMHSSGPVCAQTVVQTAGWSTIAVPDFCLGKLCQVLIYVGGPLGTFGTGMLLPVQYMQDTTQNHWIGGPNMTMGGIGFSAGLGTNGNGTPEAVLAGGSNPAGARFSMMDDSPAESSPWQWSIDFQPAAGQLTQVQVFICPLGTPVLAAAE